MVRMRAAPAAAIRSDEEQRLVEQARNGDVRAFDLLMQQNQDQVYSVALRLLGNEDDAADVTQEVFLACFRHLKTYRGEAKLSTWLYRITLNTVKNRWAQAKRHVLDLAESLDGSGDLDDPAPVEHVADPAPNPRRVAAGAEIGRVIERKLLELEPNFREVIVLRFIEGLSYEEIAELTGEMLGTIKSRIFRARQALRELMHDYLKES
ncbi:sigma-70 family RNA polymerase sigma factor [Candidatus Sumerlaeota bacterium]|nr:sigma-70 family RNA polymerase sigma factor [Candidatus Sumerlaeota bacterium]